MVVAAIVGVATSTILSASSASSSRLVVVLVEASTIQTFEGNRWRNSSRRKAPSVTTLLHASQELGWLPIPQFLRVE